MNKKIIKCLIVSSLVGAMAFLLTICGIHAEELEATTETTTTAITSAIDWIKGWSAEDIQSLFGWGIGYLVANFGVILVLVIKCGFDSVKKAKAQVEMKEIQTEADKKIIDLMEQILAKEDATKAETIQLVKNFAKEYDIKITSEVTESVANQKAVLDEYLNALKDETKE